MKRPFWSAQEALRQMEDEVPTQYPSENIRLDAMYLHVSASVPGEAFRASSSPDASTALATDQGMPDDLVPLPVAIESPPLITADVPDCSGMTHTAGFEKGSNTHEAQTENMSAATQAQVHLAAESFYDE